MNNFYKIALSVVFLSVLTSYQKRNNMDSVRLIPLEDFMKNPERTAYKISPQGTHFSFLAPYEDRLNLFVQKIGEKEKKRITSETDRGIAGYFWVNNDRIAFLKDVGGNEDFFLTAVNRDGTNEKTLTKIDSVRTSIIDGLKDDEKHVIVGLNKRNPQVFDPYRLNVETGEMEMIAENPGNITGWLTDHEGKLRIAVATDGVNQRFLHRKTEKDEFKVFLETSFKDSFSPLFFTFDNKNLYAVSNLGRDKSAAVVFDLETGKTKEVLYENKDYDVSGLYFSRKNKKLLRAGYYSSKAESYYFDEKEEGTARDIKKKTKKDFAVVSRTKEEDKYIIYTYSDRSRGAYYVYDKPSLELTHIADISPWINEEEMAKMTPIQYTSRDGLTLNGYLTLPVGQTRKTAKNLPVVVNPHGGPWARDHWGYNPEVQLLANRGYAVLQVNFRGSTGYGKKFWQASFKQWGLKMQDDITDGVKWLIKEGIADSKRIGIYGGSYGGYATLSGLTRTPDLYACGVDYVGVSSLFTFMNSFPPYWKIYLDMVYEMVGNPSNEKDSLQLVETSPLLNVEKIKSPLFVAQGANDPRVKKAESDQMVEAMRKRGVSVEYMVKDDEGHGFHNEENRFDFYRVMERFLAKHLGGRVEKKM